MKTSLKRKLRVWNDLSAIANYISFGLPLCLQQLKYWNKSHLRSEIKLWHLPYPITGNNPLLWTTWQRALMSSLKNFKRPNVQDFTTNQSFMRIWSWSPEGVCMLWSEETAAHLFPKLLWPLHHTFENILDTNQEICYSLHSTIEGPLHVSFLDSTNMAASLGQVLVLFLSIVFNNHFSVSSNRNSPIKYLISSILFELQTTVKAQQMVQLLLQEESQQETAQYIT